MWPGSVDRRARRRRTKMVEGEWPCPCSNVLKTPASGGRWMARRWPGSSADHGGWATWAAMWLRQTPCFCPAITRDPGRQPGAGGTGDVRGLAVHRGDDGRGTALPSWTRWRRQGAPMSWASHGGPGWPRTALLHRHGLLCALPPRIPAPRMRRRTRRRWRCSAIEGSHGPRGGRGVHPVQLRRLDPARTHRGGLGGAVAVAATNQGNVAEPPARRSGTGTTGRIGHLPDPCAARRARCARPTGQRPDHR